VPVAMSDVFGAEGAAPLDRVSLPAPRGPGWTRRDG